MAIDAYSLDLNIDEVSIVAGKAILRVAGDLVDQNILRLSVTGSAQLGSISWLTMRTMAD